MNKNEPATTLTGPGKPKIKYQTSIAKHTHTFIHHDLECKCCVDAYPRLSLEELLLG
jgi:hypothetical protein